MGIGNIANTGMKASMSNMEVISNNIANVNTVGFKKSSANFADLYPVGNASSILPGLGVTLNNISQDFSRGDVSPDGIQSHLSINNGNSFFIMKDPISGAVTYTRAGEFEVDNSGYFLSGTSRLQGFQSVNGTIIAPATGDLQIPTNTSPAVSTANVTETINLDAGGATIVKPFVDTDPTTYNFRTNVQVFDSLGTPATLSLFYIKTGQDTWTVNAEVGGVPVGSSAITFSTSGQITSPTTPVALAWSPTTGATAPQNISLNLAAITQYGGGSKTILPTSQDGYTAGVPGSYVIDQNGVVTLQYTNNQNVQVGQVALAQFQSNQGLQYAGNMSWQATTASGAPIINQNNSINAITSGALEMSNVDLTDEMVSLIDAQHTFQANAQVEQTYNEIMQTVIKL